VPNIKKFLRALFKSGATLLAASSSGLALRWLGHTRIRKAQPRDADKENRDTVALVSAASGCGRRRFLCSCEDRG
jgi:hypothetical protein